ncbi:MAG: hypothetical protein AVDCRST_MAG11-2418, partial [uncultured Gemmatimonadaceae bacterium]
HLERGGRRPRPGAGLAARAGARARRRAAAARAALGRPASGGRGGGRHDDRGARSVQREGQARARLDAALRELAAGLRARARL